MHDTKRYVLGFYFFLGDPMKVVLVRKNKPEWQKGLLNGPGGKIEETDPTPEHAMVREMVEETGIITTPDDWRHFATMRSTVENWEVLCLASGGENKATNCEEDQPVFMLPLERVRKSPHVENLLWLIELALDTNPRKNPVCVYYEPVPAATADRKGEQP